MNDGTVAIPVLNQKKQWILRSCQNTVKMPKIEGFVAPRHNEKGANGLLLIWNS